MNLWDTLYDMLYSSDALAISASFMWGILSVVLSPCHLSAILILFGLISRSSNTQKRALLDSGYFSIGLTITTAAVGGITILMGSIAGDLGFIGELLPGILIIVIGIVNLDIIKFNFSGSDLYQKTVAKGNFFITGGLFGIGVGPCTFAFMAPILAFVMESSDENPLLSWMMIISYTIGHVLIILLAGGMSNYFIKFLNKVGSNSSLKYSKQIVSMLLIVLGGYFLIDAVIKLG